MEGKIQWNGYKNNAPRNTAGRIDPAYFTGYIFKLLIDLFCRSGFSAFGRSL